MPNALDLVILAALAVAFAGGWQLGFVTRATSWLGLAVGLLAGARTMPWIVDRLAGAPPARVFLTLGVVLLALGSAGLLVGLVVGNRLRSVVSGAQVHTVDRIGGGTASCVGVLFVVWLLVPVMADVRQWPAQQARNSQIARLVDAVMPPPPDSIQALGRVVGEDAFPRVLDALQPTPTLVEPPAESGLDPALVAEVTRSVVQIEGVACRRIQLGSGFVVPSGHVLTNAHVVAGEPTTMVRLDDGTELTAAVVLFDPARDLAVLAVDGLDRPGLELRPGQVGESGGVFGFPGGGDLRIAPFELARHLTATGRDIYDEHRISRDVYSVAAQLQSGDSGGALVATDGAVVGMTFAVAPDRAAVAYALTATEILSALDGDLSRPVEAGACLR
jgi:S1-C subfamily serine protease